MEVIEQSNKILASTPGMLKLLTRAGRVCYKSNKEGGEVEFLRARIAQGHESLIEHGSVTVLFVTDRGITHELVRHRLASFSQESTRYVNYSGHLQFIRPHGYFLWKPIDRKMWYNAMAQVEARYTSLIRSGRKPEEARSVLPNSIATRIVMTANMREWRHVLRLRTSKPAHPQMRELMSKLLSKFRNYWPVLVEDIEVPQ